MRNSLKRTFDQTVAVRYLLFLILLCCVTALWAGPVNINTASRDELDRELEGIGVALADRIVRWRQRHGPFEKPEDIQNVPYVGIKTFEKNRHNIRVD